MRERVGAWESEPFWQGRFLTSRETQLPANHTCAGCGLAASTFSSMRSFRSHQTDCVNAGAAPALGNRRSPRPSAPRS